MTTREPVACASRWGLPLHDAGMAEASGGAVRPPVGRTDSGVLSGTENDSCHITPRFRAIRAPLYVDPSMEVVV